MSLKNEITHALKLIVEKVERELKNNYPLDIAGFVLDKLKTQISNLNFGTHKKSVAIYVSPVFEKVIYLDVEVKEKIIIDDSFEIRDLVLSKKKLLNFLVLVISSKKSKVFRGETDRLVQIIADGPGPLNNVINDAPQRVSNFSDINERKETILHKFLHRIDHSLDIILKAYQLPVFVVGPEKVIGHFKSLTRHTNAVIEYIPGNYDNATPPQLMSILQPHLSKWDQVRQKELKTLLERAAGSGKLAIGIKNVQRQATNAKGRLLIVEKDYMYTVKTSANRSAIYMPVKTYNKLSLVKDVVDEVIEKVLESGGDVEFVDNDFLSDYHHIALVKYY